MAFQKDFKSHAGSIQEITKGQKLPIGFAMPTDYWLPVASPLSTLLQYELSPTLLNFHTYTLKGTNPYLGKAYLFYLLLF